MLLHLMATILHCYTAYLIAHDSKSPSASGVESKQAHFRKLKEPSCTASFNCHSGLHILYSKLLCEMHVHVYKHMQSICICTVIKSLSASAKWIWVCFLLHDAMLKRYMLGASACLCLHEIRPGSRHRGDKCRWGGLNRRLSTNN